MAINNNKPVKGGRKTAAEQSKPTSRREKNSGSPKPTRKGAGKASVKHTRREKDAAASVKRGQKSARGVGPACEKCGQIHRRCSAHNNRGGPCMQMPLRFQQVCRSHGGNNKLSKAAAQERMLELVYPALARLEQLVLDPDTDPSIIVKVVAQILDRAHGAGLSRNATVEVGLSGTVFDQLATGVFEFDRSEIDAAPDHRSLGGGDDPDLNALAKINRDEADRETYLQGNDEADIVVGHVVDEHPTPRPTKGRKTHRGRTTSVGPIEFPATGDPRNRGTEFDPDPGGRYNPPRSQRERYETEDDG